MFEQTATVEQVATVEPTDATPAEVRDWARANGHRVGARGRISADVKHAFTRATGRTVQ